MTRKFGFFFGGKFLGSCSIAKRIFSSSAVPVDLSFRVNEQVNLLGTRDKLRKD